MAEALKTNETANDDLEYRALPHNLEAEQALLGALLINNAAAEKVQGFLAPEHFYEPVHGRIYDAITKLTERGQTADPIKLKPYFEDDPALEDVGGTSYIIRLAGSAPTVFNPEDYAGTIYDLARRRDLIEISEKMMQTAYDSPIDSSAADQIEEAEKDLFNLAELGAHEGGFKRFGGALADALENIDSARKDPDDLSGITTGLHGLNEKFGGLHKSDLVILAGRPAMGKTALATNIAFAAAKRYLADKASGADLEKSKGAVVGFFSLEMSSDQLAARILAERSGIPSDRLRRGKIRESQFREIVRAVHELEDVPLFIDDTPGLTVAALRTRARRLKRLEGLSLIVVDYLQLLRGSGKGTAGDNRVMEISEITRGLKNLAKELNVPVLALSQLSRAVEHRDNKRPHLADLRESGTIEQDADMVMFVFREEYYKEKEKPSDETSDAFLKWQAEMEMLYSRAEVIIGKQRHGPTGTVVLNFDREITRFSDPTDESRLPEQTG
ncbi:MAG: replicative DNA helicase [Sphingomonadales bacterium]